MQAPAQRSTIHDESLAQASPLRLQALEHAVPRTVEDAGEQSSAVLRAPTVRSNDVQPTVHCALSMPHALDATHHEL